MIPPVVYRCLICQQDRRLAKSRLSYPTDLIRPFKLLLEAPWAVRWAVLAGLRSAIPWPLPPLTNTLRPARRATQDGTSRVPWPVQVGIRSWGCSPLAPLRPLWPVQIASTGSRQTLDPGSIATRCKSNPQKCQPECKVKCRLFKLTLSHPTLVVQGTLRKYALSHISVPFRTLLVALAGLRNT